MRSLLHKGAIAVLGVSVVLFPAIVMAYTDVTGAPYAVEDSGWVESNGTSFTKGKVSINAKDKTRTYVQADCPAGFTLIPGASVVTKAESNAGQLTPTFTANTAPNTITGTMQNKEYTNTFLKKSKIVGSQNVMLANGKRQIQITISAQDWAFKTKKVVVSGGTDYPLAPPTVIIVTGANTTGQGWYRDTPVPICDENVNSSSSSTSSTSESSESSSSSSGYCGDMMCNEGENSINCSMDCTITSEESSSSEESTPYCGDSICDSLYEEDAISCPSDCSSSSSSESSSSSSESSSEESSSYSSMY